VTALLTVRVWRSLGTPPNWWWQGSRMTAWSCRPGRGNVPGRRWTVKHVGGPGLVIFR